MNIRLFNTLISSAPALTLAYLLCGVLGTVFGYDDNRTLARDLPAVPFVFVVMAEFDVFANVAVDILYANIDPRVTVAQ